MRMTIEEIIAKEKEMEQLHQDLLRQHQLALSGEEELKKYKELSEYHNTVANIMSEYKKVQEIITDWKNDGGAFEMSESYWLKLIREVCGVKMSEREKHIKVLEDILAYYKSREKCEGYYDSILTDKVKSLQYAISSLKTDLKYDLMYEKEEIYTKDDMIAMLEDIKKYTDDYMERKWETLTDASKAGCPTLDDWKYHIAEVVDDYVQEKIDKLKGETKDESSQC